MTKHRKSSILLNGAGVEIDTSIARLVDVLNTYGIKTLHSCEGDSRGYISIDRENTEVWMGVVNGEYHQAFNLRFPAPKRREQ